MRSVHSVSQVRAAEAVLMAELPDGALMQKAARGLAHHIVGMLGGPYGSRVLLLVGSGDNGADALYAGVVLRSRGVAVDAVVVGSSVHEKAQAAFVAAGGWRITVDDLRTRGRHYAIAVDGILGIGGRPGLKPEAVDALQAAQAAGAPRIVAVDVPSGVDVDTGALDGPHVTADVTVTFGTYKAAHLIAPASLTCGEVRLVDLGLDLPPAHLQALEAADVSRLLPHPDAQAHKYTRGVVGVRAGSAQYPGAARLCVAGANCGLAGMVRYVGPDAVAVAVAADHPEVVGQGRVQAWVVGPGGGDDAGTQLDEVWDTDVPIIVDADGLGRVAERAHRSADTVLTPHAGELAAMLDEDREAIERSGLEFARTASERFGATVLLKGRHTIIAATDGRVRVTLTGNPWLATAGAGDVLAGVIGALLAAGLDSFDAASLGSWIHGAAADRLRRPFTASDLPHMIAEVLGELVALGPK